MNDDKRIDCPHCGNELNFAVITRLKDQSRVTFSLTPEPGELLSAKTVGGAVEAVDGLFCALDKSLKLQSHVLVERVETSADGEITFHLLIARGEDHPQSKASKVKRRNQKEQGAIL